MASSDSHSARDFQLLTQSVVSFFLASTAVLSNVLLLVTIYRDPRNRNQLCRKPVTLLVVNLSVCGLLSGIVPGYVSFVHGIYSIHQGKILGVQLTIIAVAILTNIVASCTISAMCFSFWFGVSSPFQYKTRLTKAKIKVFIAVIWIYSLLFLSLYGMGVSKPVFVLLYCHLHVSLPLIILPLVYWKTYRALRLHGNKVLNLAGGRQQMAFAHRNRERKMISAFVLILVLFYVSFIPQFIAHNISAFRPSLKETVGMKLFHYISNTFTLVNCSLSPFIYAWRIPQYRQTFKAVFSGSVCRVRSNNIVSGHCINMHSLPADRLMRALP